MTDRGNEQTNRSRQGRRLSDPKRICLDVTANDHHAPQGARYPDRVPIADRIRALLSLWQEDPALAKAVSTRAQEQLLGSAGPLDQTDPPNPDPDPEVPPPS